MNSTAEFRIIKNLLSMTIYKRLQQYALLIRWNKPIGTLLLLWPTLAALCIATEGHPSALLTFIFVTGVFAMRSAGCIINDIIDRNIDKHVARTETRPLTAATISMTEAIILLVILLLISLILILFLNRTVLIIAIIGVVLSFIYPFMKRFIPLPQGVLGLVFNLGILMVFAACENLLSISAWLLFIIAIIWTISYDTLYAMSDRVYDLKLGLKSSAIWFGHHDKFIVGILQITVLIGLLILGYIINANLWFYSAVIATMLSFIYQQFLIKNRDPNLCLKTFTNNHWSWFFIFFGLFLNYH